MTQSFFLVLPSGCQEMGVEHPTVSSIIPKLPIPLGVPGPALLFLPQEHFHHPLSSQGLCYSALCQTEGMGVTGLRCKHLFEKINTDMENRGLGIGSLSHSGETVNNACGGHT